MNAASTGTYVGYPMKETSSGTPRGPSAKQIEWWTTTVETYLAPVYRFVRSRVPADCADDVVQEIFVAVARNTANFDPERGSAWQWLLAIARRRVADHFRRDRRAKPLSETVGRLRADNDAICRAIQDKSPLPDQICQRNEFRALARAALSNLEPHHRAYLQARYYEELSLEQIAKRFGSSRAAVNSALHRARQGLRQAFLDLMDEETARQEFGS